MARGFWMADVPSASVTSHSMALKVGGGRLKVFYVFLVKKKLEFVQFRAQTSVL